MTIKVDITPETVKEMYSGPYKRLWQLLCGEYLHIGGLRSAEELAQLAKIRRGSTGIDLACCLGTSMRFLVRTYGVAKMTGVDITPAVIQEGKVILANEMPNADISFVQSDIRSTGLPDGSADFVWGEDAWCYVPDKQAVVREAARLCKKGGTVAFTDIVDGVPPMTNEEAKRILPFLEFPDLQTIRTYVTWLEDAGLKVEIARDTNRFPGLMDTYLGMLETQHTYDLLKLCNFDRVIMEQNLREFRFMHGLVHEHKLSQGIFVAKKP